MVRTLSKWLKAIDRLIALVFQLIIVLYQRTLSPFFGGSCRFEPSCSNYALEAFKKKPVLKATLLTLKRISKCHPYHEGGYDPVK